MVRPELIDQLVEGVTSLTTSARWRQFLECQAKFHRYSFANTVLITVQRPDATRVAGFGAWRRLGRTVRRGERAIWILAPLVHRPADPEAEPELRGFRSVPVFDVAQTEGAELPEVCHRLAGDDPGRLYGRLRSVAAELGFSVEEAELDRSTNGDCDHRRRRIRVRAANAPAQRVKTLAHELAHAVLHETVEDRGRAELEAESTAYVVCRRLGLETGGYSFGYLAVWAGGGQPAAEAIRASGGRISRAAERLVALAEAAPVADGVAAVEDGPRSERGEGRWPTTPSRRRAPSGKRAG